MATPPLPPIWARDTTAAKLLDMPPREFRDLVERGEMPLPWVIEPGIERWKVTHLLCVREGLVHPQSDTLDHKDIWERFGLKARKPSRYISKDVRAAVYERDGHVCAYCGTDQGPFEIDHIFPVSRGGDSTLKNLTVSCKPCNFEKRARTPEEWAEDKAAQDDER